MVWAPNSGITYPFTGGGYPTPTAETDPVNFALLDTNKDGAITVLDDPYLPFYPGDEYVDWVGLSLYWYPTENLFNGPLFPTFFEDYITGTGPAVEAFNPAALNDGGLRNFYQRFVVQRNKPMLIAETGAPYFDHVSGSWTESQVKQAWWQQCMASTLAKFPRLKAITQFEEKKSDDGVLIKDWRVLNNQDTRNSYINDFGVFVSKSNLLTSNQLNYTCNGAIKFK